MKKIILLLCSFFFVFGYAFSAVRLPKIFSDNMILQRNQPVPVWGWAARSEKITVSIGTQQKTVTAGKDGKWMLKLEAMQAGGPYVLTVKGKNTIVINEVLIGEVWVCSGQSNMEMPIAGWGMVNNYEQEIKEADYPQVREFKVDKTISAFPKEDVSGGRWKICSPATAGDFSSTAYFFAREIYKKLHIPVGIINTSWGGSMIETWISRGAFEQSADFSEMINGITADSIDKIIRRKTETVQAGIKKLQDSLPSDAEVQRWVESDFDDSKWSVLTVPGMWEQQYPELNELDGWVYFRKTINLDDSDISAQASVYTGQIDDYGEVYVNGSTVGNTANDVKVFRLNPGILHAGKNVIILKVRDYGGYGGVYAKPGEVKLQCGDKEISLGGEWLFQIARPEVNGNPNAYPTLLFNSMIEPLIPFAVKGALWYQGETNAGRAYEYRKALPLLINDWRNRWKQSDFPFYYVQLSSFGPNSTDSITGSTWAELREAQAQTLSLSNTGMAVTTDIGDRYDIHPKNKQEVGRRLSLLALHKLYGDTVEFSGPQYSSMNIAGNKIVLKFLHAEGGFRVTNRYGNVQGFQVAGADKKFYWAKASVDGDGLVVYAPQVSQPVAARYGWEDDAGDANLFNKAGLPAIPFRTDNWEEITSNVKYQVGK